jgi:hypothetical protein
VIEEIMDRTLTDIDPEDVWEERKAILEEAHASPAVIASVIGSTKEKKRRGGIHGTYGSK